jgi:RNA polymerase sigma factor (sigma-70 family)
MRLNVSVSFDENLARSIDAYTEVWDDVDEGIDEDIQAAIGRLSKENQAIIRMRYIEGMKLNDIARVIKCSHRVTRYRIEKAITMLREAMADGC